MQLHLLLFLGFVSSSSLAGPLESNQFVAPGSQAESEPPSFLFLEQRRAYQNPSDPLSRMGSLLVPKSPSNPGAIIPIIPALPLPPVGGSIDIPPYIPPPDLIIGIPLPGGVFGGTAYSLFPPQGSATAISDQQLNCVYRVLTECQSSAGLAIYNACQEAIWQISEPGRGPSGNAETDDLVSSLIKRAEEKCSSESPSTPPPLVLIPVENNHRTPVVISAPGLFDRRVLAELAARFGRLIGIVER